MLEVLIWRKIEDETLSARFTRIQFNFINSTIKHTAHLLRNFISEPFYLIDPLKFEMKLTLILECHILLPRARSLSICRRSRSHLSKWNCERLVDYMFCRDRIEDFNFRTYDDMLGRRTMESNPFCQVKVCKLLH